MNSINVFVCENFAPEYAKIIEKQGFEDVHLNPFPCMCENKGDKGKVRDMLEKNLQSGLKGIIFCSRFCDILKLVSPELKERVIVEDTCFSYISNKRLLDYVIEKGGYVVGSGWLGEWKRHIENMGFDRKTAIEFYHDTCEDLVYFDTGADESSKDKLKELSEFLELPYFIISEGAERLEIMLKMVINEIKLKMENDCNHKDLMSEYAKTAEYAAMLDIMGRITACKTEREAIESVKGLFLQIMGAGKFKFYRCKENGEPVPEIISRLAKNSEFGILLKDENKFYIEIKQSDELHGYIEAGDFLVPQSIEKYYGFAANISNVIALILTNIRTHEELVRYKEELKHLSYHDSLTGLYNRTYLNHVIKIGAIRNPIVFSMDIDRLKYVNDNFGHLEGDKLIVSVSEILKKSFRKEDLVARIGGDEFVAILSDAEEKTADCIMERIKEETEKANLAIREDYLRISVSTGYAIKENENEEIDFLMKKADEKMYEDKRSKKQRSKGV
jgi:diguanylate cyclase (GGDEF)-like protein